MPSVSIRQCPKYEQCSAPICPLDADWSIRKFLSEDRVCFYLTEAVKDAAKDTFQRCGLGDLYEVIARAVSPISVQHPTIAARLEKSRTAASRMGNLVGHPA